MRCPRSVSPRSTDHFNSGATIKGSNEEDFLEGGVGGKLLGRDGNDYILTFKGLTLAKGGAGDDVLVGNGESRLVGGKGEDIFTAWGPDGGDFLKGGDFFKDFSVKDDVVALHPSFFEGPPEGHLANSYFHVGKAAETADHRVIYDKKTGILYWDADGSGIGAQEQIARLPDHLKLKADNIYLLRRLRLKPARRCAGRSGASSRPLHREPAVDPGPGPRRLDGRGDELQVWAPSTTSGKSSASRLGSFPSFRATIASAASA